MDVEKNDIKMLFLKENFRPRNVSSVDAIEFRKRIANQSPHFFRILN